MRGSWFQSKENIVFVPESPSSILIEPYYLFYYRSWASWKNEWCKKQVNHFTSTTYIHMLHKFKSFQRHRSIEPVIRRTLGQRNGDSLSSGYQPVVHCFTLYSVYYKLSFFKLIVWAGLQTSCFRLWSHGTSIGLALSSESICYV